MRIGSFLTLLLTAVLAYGQTPPQKNPAEMTTHEETPTFKTSVNMVMVPVVARDAKGRAVGNLRQEDFQLFDRGKLQSITRFTLEKSETTALVPVAREKSPGVQVVVQTPAAVPEPPDRFVAYLFDDVHARVGDLMMARDAADRQMKKHLDPKLRAAVFTTSGQTMLDFTDERDKWHETLFRLEPHPVARPNGGECPDLTYEWADLIRNHNDQEALAFAVTAAQACSGNQQDAALFVRAAVARVIATHEQEAHIPLDVLRDLVRRMSILPGERTIVLASPGFLTIIDSKEEETTIIDRAIRAKVVINSLDVRGLATETRDLSKPPPMVQSGLAQYFAYVERMDHNEFLAQSDVMAEVASGTGGTFFHNSNDLDTGFERVAGAPEYRYILGFSPQNLKLDGGVHSLKVSLVKNPDHLDLEARLNYTAPKRIDDPVEAAKAEIQEALFSREEMRDIPLQVHTEFFKTDSGSAKLAVVTHVDLKPLKLRKADGRNRDDLTVTSGVFDHNGNYVAGVQRGVDLRLMDNNLERWMRSGISVRSTLEVKPGIYLVRVVVRDSEGQLMAAQNCPVEIP